MKMNLNRRTYLIGFQNEDKTIDSIRISILDEDYAFPFLVKTLNNLKDESAIRNKFVFDEKVMHRNEYINKLESGLYAGLFVFIDHFWLFCDGKNLVPTDPIDILL